MDAKIGKVDCNSRETFQLGAAVPVPSPVRRPSSPTFKEG